MSDGNDILVARFVRIDRDSRAYSLRIDPLFEKKKFFFLRIDLPENGLRSILVSIPPTRVLELHILVVGRSSSNEVSRSK